MCHVNSTDSALPRCLVLLPLSQKLTKFLLTPQSRQHYCAMCAVRCQCECEFVCVCVHSGRSLAIRWNSFFSAPLTISLSLSLSLSLSRLHPVGSNLINNFLTNLPARLTRPQSGRSLSCSKDEPGIARGRGRGGTRDRGDSEAEAEPEPETDGEDDKQN